MISVIIPTYNEKTNIVATIRQLWIHDKANLLREIIVVDGGSTDGTVSAAASEGVKVVISPQKGRAAQMNYGAALASQDLLYFLHADTIPPPSFTEDIVRATKEEFSAGCFRLSFNYNHWFLKANCWFTRFNVDAIRFGDQSLFVKKALFEKATGFCEKHILLEDQEFIKRLKQMDRFIVMKKTVITSARKYLDNGIYKTQGIFFIIYLLYRLRFPQQTLVAIYRKLIRQDKL